MFGIGGTELFIIALFAFIIFGPDKVPELARTLGKAMRVFKSAQEDMEKVIKAEVYSPFSETEREKVASATTETPQVDSDIAKASAASSIWAATEEDDEEEDEE